MEHKGSPEARKGVLPDGFREIRMRHGWGWSRPEALSWFQEALANSPTLYAAAGDLHRSSPSRGPLLRGRAPVFVVSLDFTTVAVRHYLRGGAVASLLGDRYLRLGAPRPIAETLASERVRSLGIPTPRVVAAAIYPHGPFYRGDIATEFIAGGADLGEFLFGGAEPGGSLESSPDARSRSDASGENGTIGGGSDRISALRETMGLIERLGAAGIYHPDLNVKNFLVESGPSSMTVHLLDLDRCRSASGRSGAPREAMVRRLRSSLAKWERMTDHRLTPEEWETTGYIPMS